MARVKRAQRGRPPNEVPSALLEARVPAPLVELVHEKAGKAGMRLGQFLAHVLERAPAKEEGGPQPLGLGVQRTTPALNARRGDIFYIDYNDPNVIVELNTNKNHPSTTRASSTR